MGKPIKITFVINNLSGGGAERILVNLLNNINQTKIQPTLFLFEKQGSYLQDLNKDILIKYARLSKEGKLGKIEKLKRVLLRGSIGVSSLTKAIEDQDLVVAFLEKGVTYLTYEACRRANKPCYAWLHNNIEDSFGEIHKVLSQFVYKRINKVICVSKECEDLAIQKFPFLHGKIKTIYNPIDLDNIIKKSLEPCNFNLPKGVNIVAIGRLTEQKGFDILLKSFEHIAKKYDSLNLIILGEGEQRTKLEELVRDLELKEKVYLPGFVDNPYAILKKSDIFVLSSRYEGLPTVLIEALTLNKKIVSTRCSGASEILLDGVCGKLVDINDIDALSFAIEDVLNSPNLVQGYDRAKVFDKCKIMDEIERLLVNYDKEEEVL